MTIRLSFLATFCFISACLLLTVANVSAAPRQQALEEMPMSFALVRNGNCKEICIQWISAEGKITADTPKRFKKLVKRLNGRKLPVVFQSSGGNVDAALSVGRMIRAAGLETAVGRTQLNDCPMLEPRCPERIVKTGWSEGEVRAGGAYCFSACPLAMAGGKVRAAAANAYIGLHQITNGSSPPRTGPRDLDAISTRSDPALKAMLSTYLDEMGVSSDDVFAMMGLATPKGLYDVRSAEALKSGIITKVFSYADEPGYVVSGADVEIRAFANASDDECAPIQTMAAKLDAIGKGKVVHLSIFRGGGTIAEEFIIVGTKQYWRREKGPWSVSPREPFPMQNISDCTYVGEELVDAKKMHVYAFDRRFPYGIARVRMWIAQDSGLPVKSHYKDVTPNAASFERSLTFSFAEDIREPM
jgi:hypothetical protein